MKPKLRIGSLILRAIAVAVAAMCIAWGVAPSSAITSAVIGSLLGVGIGQALGRTRLRLPAIVLFAIAFGGASFWIAGLAVNHEAIPRAIGTSGALRVALVLKFGAVALAAFGALRAVATRRPSALVLELGAIAGSIAYVFAAHREGIISRPLWLSDWAWENGIDPVNVFLVLGGVAVVVLGLLLVAEAEERKGSAAAVLALFAVLGVVLIIAIGPPKAEPDDRLNLTTSPSGSASASAAPSLPPPPTPPSSAQPDAGDADGGGAKPKDQDPDGGPAKPDNDPDGGSAKPKDQDPDGGSAKPQDQGPDGGSAEPQQHDGGGSDPMDAGADGGDKNDGGDGGKPPPAPASESLPNESSEPDESPAPMAVVIFENDYSPPSETYYFRQEAWSQWNGTKLVRTSRADVDLDGLEAFPSEPTGVRDPVDAAGREKVSARVALLVEHTRPFGLESPISFKPLGNPNPSRFVRAYGFESLAQQIPYKKLRGRKAGNPAWSEDVRKYYLQTTDDPRFASLAKGIKDTLGPKEQADPFVVAVRIKLYLDENYKYSRKSQHAGVENPTADFLFGDHIGYCVHFAHAAVLLWRTLGIPSRVGTGYAVEEKNRQGGSAMLIRPADAHAWPEIYLEGAGWVVLDITPHESLDESPPPVDDDLQRLLGEMAREMPPDPKSTDLKPPVKPDWKKIGRVVGMSLGAVLSALVLMAYLAKVWRRAAPLFARPRSLARVGYRTSLDLLSEAGFARDRGESREAFAERIREKVPSFERITAMHLAAALGKGRDEPGDADVELLFAEPLDERRHDAWRAALGKLRSDLEKVPTWRRMLGFINPVSFFRSR
ncbi:MAG: transglutaminase domain-containing protein [Polyangiaceae bacterium]